MDQQAKSMLALPKDFAISDIFWAAVGRISLLAKYFANSDFLRVCGVKFAILTQNSSKSILQCTMNIQQLTYHYKTSLMAILT
jgi:hypothetical protein